MQQSDLDGAQAHDPIVWFHTSLARATALESFDATRAALACADAQGRPSVRFVLVKQVDAQGFRFYTNYNSRKARELSDNPRAALVFHWASIGEQVRIDGDVSKLSSQQSDAYFASRPRASQLGAWASQQSESISSRAALDAQWLAAEQRFASVADIPRPSHWGGYLLAPSVIRVLA